MRDRGRRARRRVSPFWSGRTSLECGLLVSNDLDVYQKAEPNSGTGAYNASNHHHPLVWPRLLVALGALNPIIYIEFLSKTVAFGCARL